jgi:DNA (cytosine-5)-methyltransferase 1
MGVPQTRQRVFFIALRKDVFKGFDLHSLNMSFNYEPITYGMIKTPTGDKITAKSILELLPHVEYGDIYLAAACEKVKGKKSFFNEMILYDDRPCWTLRAKPSYYRYGTDESITIEDIIRVQTFPTDYDFINYTKSNVCYICGMSVPPIMIKRIVNRLIESGIFKYKENEDV